MGPLEVSSAEKVNSPVCPPDSAAVGRSASMLTSGQLATSPLALPPAPS